MAVHINICTAKLHSQTKQETNMSTELKPLESDFNFDVRVTSFFGGDVRGKMIQLTQWNDRTQQHECVNMTEEQAVQLAIELLKWMK
jgi:hypothetical protein